MNIGKRIKELRLKKKWTQGDLAKKTKTSIKQISQYELNAALPSVDKLIRLSNALNVSIDYLLLDKVSNESKELIKDRNLLERFKLIEQLPTKEKSFVLRVIDCLLLEQELNKVSKLKK